MGDVGRSEEGGWGQVGAAGLNVVPITPPTFPRLSPLTISLRLGQMLPPGLQSEKWPRVREPHRHPLHGLQQREGAAQQPSPRMQRSAMLRHRAAVKAMVKTMTAAMLMTVTRDDVLLQ